MRHTQQEDLVDSFFRHTLILFALGMPYMCILFPNIVFVYQWGWKGVKYLDHLVAFSAPLTAAVLAGARRATGVSCVRCRY